MSVPERLIVPRASSAARRRLEEILRREAAGQRVVPLAYAQQELWHASPFPPEDSSNHYHSIIHVEGPLDIPLFEHCLNETIARHEALRTSFQDLEGEVFQVISGPRPVRIRIEHRSLPGGLPRESWDAIVGELLEEDLSHPFDLAEGQLMRLSFVELAPGIHRALLTGHHAVVDGWSMGLLQRDLLGFYSGYRRGERSLPSGPVLQLREHARAQAEALRGGRGEALLRFWCSQLANAPASVTLSRKRPRPENSSRRAAIKRLLPRECADSLRNLARSEQVTLFVILSAVFAAFVWKRTSEEDFVLGVPVANRSLPGAGEVLGYLSNTMALRLQVSGDPTFREFTRRVRDSVRKSLEHQELPFALLVKDLCPDWRMHCDLPLFRLRFALQNYPMPSVPDVGISARILELDSGTSRYDMALEIFEAEQGFQLVFRYRTCLFEKEEILEDAGLFINILQKAILDPDTRLSFLAG